MRRAHLTFIIVAIISQFSSTSAGSSRVGSEQARHESEFAVFLEKVDWAQVEFVQGRPAAFKALWSHQPDVTLFGGFGSGEQGWPKVGPRLDWASSQFSEGSRSHQVLSSLVQGDLGYVVQIERTQFEAPGRREESSLELRTTMVLRRESDGWWVVHRHADGQIGEAGTSLDLPFRSVLPDCCIDRLRPTSVGRTERDERAVGWGGPTRTA